MHYARFMTTLVTVAILTACGGGGGGGGGAGTAPAPNPQPNPPPPPTQSQMNEASQLLSVATFGATYDEINDAAEGGLDTWLDNQLAMPPSRHLPIVNRYLAEYGYDINDTPNPGVYRRYAFWESILQAPDQLRQLTAYALTQIFVVSDNVDAIFIDPRALADYYDTLLVHGFGNFRDLLLAVTLHPVMGFYLSHVNNGKTDPVANTFPDENYAREVMQLFSIGLFELNPDGTLKTDTDGNPIPTYDNTDIREFAKVFTGLSYGPENPGDPSFFGKQRPVFHVPMVMFEEFHEPGDKHLLNGTIVPAGQTGMEDIEDAIDNLFNHENVAPFIGRLLIQRLVTSHPSPEYVARVSAAFAGDGTTPRGDMRTVIRAILTDPEASEGIRLREPFRRYIALNRTLGARSEEGIFPGLGFVAQYLTQQHVLSAPSVFNFYLPAFSPAGPLGDDGLHAPEFQITNASTIVGVTNLIAYSLYAPESIDTAEEFAPIELDLDALLDLASDTEALLDRVDLLFFGGTMSDETRTIIRDVVDEIDPQPLDKVRLTLYLALASPEWAVAGGSP